MSNLYVGFRIEVPSKYIVRNFVKRFNSSQKNIMVTDLYRCGKIIIEKKQDMLIAHGEKTTKAISSFANFSLVMGVASKKDLERIVRIVNVLGNDRLIKEKAYTFACGKSVLNDLPELNPLKDAMIRAERISPGFINAAWFYAPEAICV